MIEKIDSGQVQDLLEKSAPKQPNPQKAPSIGADVSLQVDYAALLDKAAQTQQTETGAVERAQELFLSGQLDSLENIRPAAEKIVKLGV
jgi:hypothetical protein